MYIPEIETKSPEEISSYQELELGKLLEYLKSKSVFYNNLFKKNKINLVVADTDSLEMDMNNFLKKCNKLKPKMLTICIGDRKGESGKNKNVKITPDLFIPKPIEINGVVKKVSQLLMTVR